MDYCRFSVGETLKAYKGCILKLRQQQQLYIEEQDDQHLFEVEHGILDILGRAHFGKDVYPPPPPENEFCPSV